MKNLGTLPLSILLFVVTIVLLSFSLMLGAQPANLGIIVSKLGEFVGKFAIAVPLIFALNAGFFKLVLGIGLTELRAKWRQDGNYSYVFLFIGLTLAAIQPMLASHGATIDAYLLMILHRTLFSIAASAFAVPAVMRVFFGIRTRQQLIEAVVTVSDDRDALLLAATILISFMVGAYA